MNALLHFDGSYRPKENDSCFIAQAGWSVVILSNPLVLASDRTPIKEISSGSTEAEADGLFAGLQFLAKFRNISKLLIVSDCMPVVEALRKYKNKRYWKLSQTSGKFHEKKYNPTWLRVRSAATVLLGWGGGLEYS